MLDVLTDTLIDMAKLLPLLFLAYLLMEFLERRMGERTQRLIERSGKLGPAIGGALGLVPQCGFSAAASGLFSGGVISVGTLIAVFLSTSDEMLPIMISQQASAALILKILAVKLAVGVAVGFAVDLIIRRPATGKISEMCERENCNCEHDGILISALKHTLSVGIFILIITLALNTAVYFIGEETLSSLIVVRPVIGALITSAVGLIPNCAASVLITELYMDGVITAGALIAGLLSGSGVGLLVLFRANRNMRQSLLILAALYTVGAVVGVIMDALSIVL